MILARTIRVFVWLVQVFVLGVLGYTAFVLWGPAIAFGALAAIDILWLVGMKNASDSKINDFRVELFGLMTEIRLDRAKKG